jgi:glycosyltransferase involved in cell wall biosynthesis
MPSEPAPLSVVLVIGSFTPREGGSERQLRQVLATLAGRGHRCAVVTQALPAQRRRTMVEGVRVLRVGSLTLFRRAPWSGHLAFTFSALAATLIARPSVVVSTQMGSASVVARTVSMLTGRPHILRLTGGGGGSVDRSEVDVRAASGRGRLLMRLAVGRRTMVVAPSAHLLDPVERHLGLSRDRLRTIPNGVATAAATQERDLDVLWYYRGGQSKNVDAFVRLLELLPDVAFTVIGREVDARIAEAPNVQCLGWVDRPEQVVARCGALVNTSPAEGSPNLCLQAVAAGTPVAGFAVSGMREFAQSHPAPVRLVPMGDLPALADAIRSLRSQRFEPETTVPSIESASDEWTEVVRSWTATVRAGRNP